jgi:hypothetical protein
MKRPKHEYAGTTDEDILVSLCLLITGEKLRRAVARCLWFDLVEYMPAGQHLNRLKLIADPERLDEEIDWNEDDLYRALMIVGYKAEQIRERMTVHHAQRLREQQGIALSEHDRIIENGGIKANVNQWLMA